MSFNRHFGPERKAQGFRSQAHLDAFYAYYDHTKACAACQTRGKPVYIFDCWHETQNRCDEAKRLDAIERSLSGAEG
jgi:hypothetical protein